MLTTKLSDRPLTAEAKRMVMVVLGTVLLAFGTNMFVLPAGFYSGGFMGICQVIRTALETYTGLSFSFDISGLLYFAMNVPIIIISWFVLSRRFVARTIFNVVLLTVLLTVLPQVALVEDDTITNALIGGVVCGAGTGLTLLGAASGGGSDALGCILTKKVPGFSVGKLNLIINVILYAACFLMFDPQTAIYSIIYAAVASFAMDHLHQQNIVMEALVITAEDPAPMETEVMRLLGRGVTQLSAKGAYTGGDKAVLMTLISKYETHEFRDIITKHDPHAFITFKNVPRVFGNFTQKL